MIGDGLRILDWPLDLNPSSAAFWLNPHTGGSKSPITDTRKTYRRRPQWMTTIGFTAPRSGGNGSAARGARLDALIADLEGGATLIRLWDFWRPYPFRLRRYYGQFAGETYTFGGGETFTLGERFFIPADAEPTNEAAAAGDETIVFAGFLPGEQVFDAGDYFGGDGRPHMIMAPGGVADADGRAEVRFRPPLDADLLPGAAITMRPPGLFALTSKDAGKNDATRTQRASWTLDFEEYLG